MSFSTILHKRSSVSSAIPSITSLSAGEIAINTADGRLFIKGTNDTIKTFLNAEDLPYQLNQSLSSINFQIGSNVVTGVLAGVLGGIDNDVSGAGSTVINGSDNDIAADYAIIGNGSNNTILSGGDFGAILGGQNNILNHPESFILGSNITSHLSGITYVNNISATGKLYGDGSELTGIVPQIDVVLTSDPLKFVFIGDGSTASYTISGTAASTNAALIEVFVDNVRQEPTISYSLSANIVEFTQAPSLSSRIVVITPNTVAGQLSVAKRHEFVDEDTYSISYAAIASFGTPENSPFWRITKITFTDFGSVSATQYANDVAWTDRLIVSYT